MSDNPLISVIMPVHNAGKYLQQAVDSILLQSYQQIELILVDDHSEDDAIQQLAANDQRVKILGSSRRGVEHAMNYGAGQSRGEFIARMDADDEALPHRLQVQLNYLKQNPDIGIVATQVEIFSDENLGEGNRVYQDWLNSICTPEQIQRELYVESPLPNPTVMFRREVYGQLGGYHDSDWAEDYDCWLRADSLKIKMGKPDGIMLRWRDHDNRLTRSDIRYSLDNFRKAKAHYLVQSHLQGKDIVIWGTGPIGVQFHDLLKKDNVNISGFIEVNQRRIGGVKRDLPVWPIEVVEQLDDKFIIGAVGSRGAREKMRAFLQQKGKQEGKDFIFVA